MPRDGWARLTHVEACPPGRAKFMSVRGHELAIFHLTDPDRFVVTPNSCPHAGASLAGGEISGNQVTCPWHHWSFDLDTGACACAEHVTLARFACRVEDDVLYVKLPDSGR